MTNLPQERDRRPRLARHRRRARRGRLRVDRPSAHRRRVRPPGRPVRRRPAVPLHRRHGAPTASDRASTATSTIRCPSRWSRSPRRCAGRTCCRLPASSEPAARTRSAVARSTRRVARRLPRAPASAATDAAPPQLRAGRLERPAPRSVRRPGVPAAGRGRPRSTRADYTGGEFVVVEQRPRPSRATATVIPRWPRRRLHHPRPTGPIQPRLVGGSDAPRSEHGAVRAAAVRSG